MGINMEQLSCVRGLEFDCISLRNLSRPQGWPPDWISERASLQYKHSDGENHFGGGHFVTSCLPSTPLPRHCNCWCLQNLFMTHLCLPIPKSELCGDRDRQEQQDYSRNVHFANNLLGNLNEQLLPLNNSYFFLYAKMLMRELTY